MQVCRQGFSRALRGTAFRHSRPGTPYGPPTGNPQKARRSDSAFTPPEGRTVNASFGCCLQDAGVPLRFSGFRQHFPSRMTLFPVFPFRAYHLRLQRLREPFEKRG